MPSFRGYTLNLTLPRPQSLVFNLTITLPSQGRAPELSGLYDIPSKWQRRTPVRNKHTLMHLHRALMRLRKGTHTHQYAQIKLPSELWILFLVVLISISPNFCSGGACTNLVFDSPVTCLAETLTLGLFDNLAHSFVIR